MANRFRNALILATLASAALWMPACEKTPLTPPQDGEVRLFASPQTVVIDEPAGETEGQSSITAQIFDDRGRAMIGASVLFTASSGTLASGGAPNDVTTDSNGIATDTLTLTLTDDASVEVGAVSGILNTTVTVTKTVSTGNIQPTATLVASPTSAQVKNQTVVFDGRSSSDPDGQITCYQFEINSTDDANDEIAQGQTLSSISRSYALEQTLSIILRVSDDPAATTWCRGGGTPAPPSNFSPNTDFINGYQIACDLTNPFANAGADQTLQGTTVTVALNGSLSNDPDSAITTYTWDCANGQAVQSGPDSTIDCTYTRSGTLPRVWTASLTVENECGLRDTDTVNITVTP